MGVIGPVNAADKPPLLPTVEVEENVYTTPPANNGAGPMWCYGSTSIARRGQDVFASGIETIPDQKPLNNVRWMVFQRGSKGWQLMQSDPTGRQREPCPLGIFEDGRLLLTTNPTLTKPEDYSGPAQPQLLIFDTRNLKAAPQVSLPQWEGEPKFSEHSYRGFTVDGRNHEALYLQNVGYDTSYYSFLDRTGQWSKCGAIKMPWGAEFEKPEAIRVCYQNMALRNRAAHIMGVSDIIEWVKEWREFKLVLHGGKSWDYDFRRLYYCWTPDLTKQGFSEWVKVADAEHCGHISNLDMWLDPQGRAHILWLEQSIWDARVRDKFWPEEPITYALMYGIIDQGKVVRKVRLMFGGEKQESKEIPGWGRFQATPDGRLFVFYYTGGADAQGRALAENRLIELYEDGTFSPPVRVAMQHPMNSFFTATERGGSAPSATLDLLGQANGVDGISYARINLLNKVLASFDYTIKATPEGSEVSLDGSGSRAAAGKIVSYAWQIGDRQATGPMVQQKLLHGGSLPVTLTVKDAQGNTNRCTRTLQLPPAPYDFGLKQWGLVLRIEAEQFAAEGGGEPIHVRNDKLNASALSLSHSDPKGLWLQWEFDAPVADKYYLLARYAVPTNSARAVTLDGQPLGEFLFPSTGGYGSDTADNWGITAMQANGRPAALTLAAGKHTLKLENENGLGLNLDYFELRAAKAPMPAGSVPGWRAMQQDGIHWLMALSGTLSATRITPEIGFCYNYNLGPLYPGDGVKDVPPSTLRLFEDGKELAPAHVVHVDIREKGQGRFSHWITALYLSASDNSDPRTNGRKYTWQIER
jgi:hypothetical protein